MNNQYTISTQDNKLLIKTTINPNDLTKRLNQLARTFRQEHLLITDSNNKSTLWSYNKALDIRDQLETLVVQNFKDAWEESKSSLMFDTTLTEEEIDEDQLVDEYLFDYLQGLEKLIKQESGLFK